MRMLYVFVVSLLLSPLVGAGESGSVFFIDVSNDQYLRARSSNYVAESDQLSLNEVGSAVSVLLGLAPLATLTADGSSKLNNILKPNPFYRPRHVLMLEVTGVSDVQSKHALLSSALKSDVFPNSDKSDIQLPGEKEVFLVSLDEASGNCNDEGISDLALWLGGSYAANPLKPMSGLLSIPLENSGITVDFNMEKKADREFALSLLALSQNVRKAVDLHKDLVQSIQRPAELMLGSFRGIKALQEEYGAEGATKQGMEVLLVALSKIFDSLKKSYEGQLVGVILCTPESQSVVDSVHAPRSYPRLLAEAKGSSNATKPAPEVVLVRRTLAWLTGIILLIATLLGTYFLLNMPLTKDTLLYSNVKID